jgi:limonene 1,2-monooxygenase
MRFGIWSNGMRPHTTAAETYEADLREIVLADELGFSEAWISEHHGEPAYLGRVDVLSLPELLMCKAAALTTQIRFGAAVKVIHLSHPVDIALQTAITDHLLGGRYLFGFGAGFPSAIYSDQRGLTYDDRHERTLEALELIERCWQSEEPFDWAGRFFNGRRISVLPKPLQQPHPPIATATATPATLALAGERGWELLAAGTAGSARAGADIYARAALEAGHERPLERVRVSCFVYVADSVEQAIEEMRPAVEWEMGYQRLRGVFRSFAAAFGQTDPDAVTFEDLIDIGFYVVGDPDTVTARLERIYEQAGGFGTLLLGMGKSWATAEKREESLRRFASEVAPRLAHLTADRVPEEAAA